MKAIPVSGLPLVFRHTRQPGFWIGVAMAALMLVNATRCLLDPAAFSVYFGLPLTAASALPWVGVYGLRALFIGLLAGYFLLRREPGPLQWVAAFAIVMPLGDAWLVHSNGGTTAWRHLLIASVLVVGTICIRAWHQGVVRHGKGARPGSAA